MLGALLSCSVVVNLYLLSREHKPVCKGSFTVCLCEFLDTLTRSAENVSEHFIFINTNVWLSLIEGTASYHTEHDRSAGDQPSNTVNIISKYDLRHDHS